MSRSASWAGKTLRVALRVLVLAGIWWALSRGDPRSWIVGLPTVLAAAVLAAVFWPPATWRLRLLGVFRFLPLFAYYSLIGGIDVASRAFRPRMPLAPALVDHALLLPQGTGRVFFVGVVSLLPGTLSAELHGDSLTVHVLDRSMPIVQQLREVEATVACLFGVSLTSRQDHREAGS